MRKAQSQFQRLVNDMDQGTQKQPQLLRKNTDLKDQINKNFGLLQKTVCEMIVEKW